MSITPLPPYPSRSEQGDAFVATTETWMAAIATWTGEVNALTASLNMLSFGGAGTLPYTFSTTTTQADPGNGFLRLNNATQSSATAIYVDLLTADGLLRTSTLDTFDDSTSVVKGQIRLTKASDATKFLLFNVMGITTQTGYRVLTVVPVDSSSTTPFANNDSIVLSFSRTGDMGATGPTAGMAKSAAIEIAVAGPTINLLTAFNSGYDNYLLLGNRISPSANDILNLRMANSTVDVSSNYQVAAGATLTLAAATTTMAISSNTLRANDANYSFAINFQNVNDTVNMKVIHGTGVAINSAGSKVIERFAGSYNNTNKATGLSLYWNAGNNFVIGSKVILLGYQN